MKEEHPQEIVHAIHDVLGGHIYVSEEVLAGREKSSPATKLGSREDKGPLDELTDVELRVLELLGQGRSNVEIAQHLRLKTAEIPGHHTQLRKKLNLKTNNALIRYAVCWVETGVV
jgi:DNA-binding NarL/FixJ family response regulator